MPLPLEKVRRAINSFSVSAGEKVVVAVSGGPDSVCLLHLLKSLFPDRPLQLHVAHLNHGLRPESREEARFVEVLSRKWDLPFTGKTLNATEYPKKESVQVEARRLRYHFLREVARHFGAKWIALGHQADDQAETFLMRILRGSGVTGLSGIPAMRDNAIIRPLLDCTRGEIMAELSRQGISFMRDSSNKKTVYQRNRVRHHLIPILQSYNPKIKANFCRETVLLRDENDFIEQSLSTILPSLEITIHDSSVVFKTEKIAALHPALQRRALRTSLAHLGKPDFKTIEIIRQQMILEVREMKLSLPQSLVAERRGMVLQITKMERPYRIKSVWPEIKEQILHEITDSISNTNIDLREWEIRLKVSLTPKRETRGFSPALSTCIASFDFDNISLPLSIRSWRPGDRFVPFGMHGHRKKLQDFFMDHKIKKSERHRKPLLCSREGILWVLGLRIDERFCVTKDTSRILTVETQRIHAAP